MTTHLRVLACLSFAVTLAVAGMATNPATADPPGPPHGPPANKLPGCTALPAKLLGGNIKYANAQIVPANTAPAPQAANFKGTPPSSGKASVAYCLVVLSYSSTPAEDPTPQNITIYVGLPLNTADGGVTGSKVNPPWNFTTVQGNWNGRTEGTGGGGCSGNTSVTGPVVNGFVGSGTDGGHGPGNVDYSDNSCDQAVPSLGHLNTQYIRDWVYNGPQQEILSSKAVAKLYYGRAPLYNYWNGCSTGGHQGMALAQTLAGELDGILASAPAMYWTRFQTAQMWGQIAMLDIADEVIPLAKLAAVQKAAIAACDGNDGVLDGIIDDPRTCTFNANTNVCGQPNAPASSCLTPAEANAVNTMWDGPRNNSGNRIWFPIDRGTDFSGWDGNVPFGLAPVQFGWDLENPAYYAAGSYPSSYPGYWGNVALNAKVQSSPPQPGAPSYVTNYAVVAQDGSNNVGDLTDTFGDLDALRAKGGKLVTFVGGNDQLIMPRGVINYYRVMAQRYRLAHDLTRFDGVQQFYRLFHVPGTGHCGGAVGQVNSLGPWPQAGVDFDAVINWVENGVPPSEVIGTGHQSGGTTLTRPTCPYPQTAVYVGSGNILEAANWVCGGNLEKNVPIGTPLSGPSGLPVPCYDVLVHYKHEVNGSLDYKGSGVDPATCGVH
jgi:hypothetical protein